MLKSTFISAILSLASISSFAAEYYVVVPVKGKAAPAAQITVALSPAALPPATVGTAYSYNLRDHLLVTGDKSLDINQASLTTADALPAGLTLAATGVLAGTPTVKSEAGSSFQVRATYKSKTGQQTYTIVVNGEVLEVVQIAAGLYHTCAVTASGGAKCWGSDGMGQLGNDEALTDQPTPVDVAGLTSGVARIATGFYHTCAVTVSGGAKCWGYDNYGQLGDDALVGNKSTPVDVMGLTSGMANISAGSVHTCALTVSGGVKCWGRDNYGQLGNDTSLTTQYLPVDVAGLTSGVVSISAGSIHTCAVTDAGGAKCWGADNNGQVGNDGAVVARVPTPVDVAGLTSGVSSISAGYFHTCAVTVAGGAKCWGSDGSGQLGNDAALSYQPMPVDVAGLTSGVVSISSGGDHTCAVTSARGVKCWGRDGEGQLGDDATLANQPTPVDVAGLDSGVAVISSGGNHTCAVSTSRKLKCWGLNDTGQLGNNGMPNSQTTPVDVAN